MTIRTMKCHSCEKVFDTDRDNEDALAEMRENFGDVPESERCIVCEDCYKQFMEWFNSTSTRQ